MPEIMANTNHGKYPILIRTGALAQLGEVAAKTVRSRKAFIVTDDIVEGLYYSAAEKALVASGFEVAHYTIPNGESSKCEKNLFEIYTAMNDFGMARTDLVIALGGGVVGDLAGGPSEVPVESTYGRGHGGGHQVRMYPRRDAFRGDREGPGGHGVDDRALRKDQDDRCPE